MTSHRVVMIAITQAFNGIPLQASAHIRIQLETQAPILLQNINKRAMTQIK